MSEPNQTSELRGSGDTRRVSSDSVWNARGWARTLNATGVYPVVACSALAVGAFYARWQWTGVPAFLFMLWNLFLAWVPWFLALPFGATSRRSWWHAPLLVTWLLCLPNAPYMITDIIHLRRSAVVPLWFDTTLLFLFAWTGCLLGFLSLKTVHAWVETQWGRLVGWLFVSGVAVLSGFGIYLGRFRRWNSWDVLTRPEHLLADTWRQLSHPHLSGRTWVVTILFGAFFFCAYWAMASGRRRWRRE